MSETLNRAYNISFSKKLPQKSTDRGGLKSGGKAAFSPPLLMDFTFILCYLKHSVKDQENKGLVPVSDMLKGFFEKSPFAREGSEPWFFFQLWQVWPRLDHAQVIPCARPVRYQKGHLWIGVQNAVQLQEMSFYTEHLKTAINNHFNKKWIRKISLSVHAHQIKMKEHIIKELQKYDLKK